MFMYLGQLDSNYIIFWNAEIFRKHLIFEKKNLEESKESDGIFRNIPVCENGILKLINYSTNMCQSVQGTRDIIIYIYI